MTNTKRHAVVVGAGITGLSLAALLATHDGYDVTVYEKAPHVGGRARVHHQEGFSLDLGIHLIRFGGKSALARTLARCASSRTPAAKFVDVGLSYLYQGDSQPERPWEVFPTGIKGFLKTKLASKWKLAGLIRKFRKLSFPEALETPVQAFIDQHDLTGGLRDYVALVAASMQVCPFLERASVGELRRNMQEVLKKRKSVTYMEGGWTEIFQRLQRAVETRGRVEVGTPVEHIVVTDGTATGVKVGGEVHAADLVVSAIPVQDLFSVLDPDTTTPEFVGLCEGLQPTAGISLDVALDAPIRDDQGLFYFKDPAAFGVFTANLDPSQAPAGRQLFTIFAPRERAEVLDTSARAVTLDRLRDVLFHAFPTMEDHMVFERPLFLPMVDGVEVNVNQYQERRPGFQVPGVQHLHLVGDALAAPGAGGDIGHNSVWGCWDSLHGRAA